MKPLLLSPAGDMKALDSAIRSGADEVYLGGPAFNARANARNFDENGLILASEKCRESGVGMHITLNTLVFERELPSAMKYVSFLAEKVRPSALIVQDIGLASEIKREFPELCLHASTQMRIHSARDVEYLKTLGFSRAVLARELPREDIAEFVKSGMETEIFVHGALCVCESGGCLMSALIGGRSGNRGECAQPCRLPYKGNNRYPLSLSDLCLAPHIREIASLGVKSLKIEGRMKSADYVGAVTAVYRRLIDEGRNASPEEMRLLSDIFSRSGFTDGYYASKVTPKMFGVRREEDKERSQGVRAPSVDFKRQKADVAPAIPAKMPERNIEKVQHPRDQLGLVFRFEGALPPRRLLTELYPLANRIDIPLSECKNPVLDGFTDKVSIIMPRLSFVREEGEITALLDAARSRGVRHATVSSFSHFTLCDGFYLHGDYVLNAVNSRTVDTYSRFSLSSVMLSPECDARTVKGAKCALEYIGYGKLPVMHTQTCIIRNVEKCQNAPKCYGILTDRTGASFPIISSFGHRNTIYNSVPSYHLDKRKELKKQGIGLITLLFTDENERMIEEVVALAQTGKLPSFAYTRR